MAMYRFYISFYDVVHLTHIIKDYYYYYYYYYYY